MNRRSNAHKFWWMAGFLVAFLCLTNALKAATQTENAIYDSMQKEWAFIKYQAPDSEKLKLFEQLISNNEAKLKNQNQNQNQNITLWHAIALSSYAQLKGGLTGLKKAKEAKQLLELILNKNGEIGDGLGHAVLGALYARVPGWPVGFGNKIKAEWHLKTAYAINPKGMDVNYYYGDYLADQHENKLAKFHVEEGLKAKGSADLIYREGRINEIQHVLSKLKSTF